MCGCGVHLGWRFDWAYMHAELRPSFWGLRRSGVAVAVPVMFVRGG